MQRKEIIDLNSGSMRIIALNRPKQMNSLNLDMVRQLAARFRAYDKGQNTCALLISTSKKFFCAGGDVVGNHDWFYLTQSYDAHSKQITQHTLKFTVLRLRSKN